MDRGLELFISIHKDLAESKTWKPPRVFINPTVGPTLMQQLTESVKRHQVGGWVGCLLCRQTVSCGITCASRLAYMCANNSH